jgi:hypothetical protein
MKKLFLYVALGLLWCNVGLAEDNKPERNVIESDFNNAWQIDNKFIIPECFHIIRFGGGSGAEWYRKFFDEYIEKPVGNHFDNPKFENFIINIGEYLNKEVPLNHTIKPNWPDYRPSEISISQNLEECLSENPETKITPSPFGKTLEYRVVETFDINIGKELAPHINENFESIKKVEIQDWGGGTMPAQSHENIYGILKVDGKKIILPLKNDLIINKY